MSAFLPHHDPDPAARSLALEQAQAEYQYNYTYASPLAMVDQVPYRDDALPYGGAIRKWVSDYLAVYYVHDADLQIDEELLGWFRELTATHGGRVTGLGRDGGLTRDYLTDVAAGIPQSINI